MNPGRRLVPYTTRLITAFKYPDHDAPAFDLTGSLTDLLVTLQPAARFALIPAPRCAMHPNHQSPSVTQGSPSSKLLVFSSGTRAKPQEVESVCHVMTDRSGILSVIIYSAELILTIALYL